MISSRANIKGYRTPLREVDDIFTDLVGQGIPTPHQKNVHENSQIAIRPMKKRALPRRWDSEMSHFVHRPSISIKSIKNGRIDKIEALHKSNIEK